MSEIAKKYLKSSFIIYLLLLHFLVIVWCPYVKFHVIDNAILIKVFDNTIVLSKN